MAALYPVFTSKDNDQMGEIIPLKRSCCMCKNSATVFIKYQNIDKPISPEIKKYFCDEHKPKDNNK